MPSIPARTGTCTGTQVVPPSEVVIITPEVFLSPVPTAQHSWTLAQLTDSIRAAEPDDGGSTVQDEPSFEVTAMKLELVPPGVAFPTATQCVVLAQAMLLTRLWVPPTLGTHARFHVPPPLLVVQEKSVMT
jgi:hypothetical protein